ncbi:MAG: phosphoribosylglycinamide formyltransferase [Balneolia bacterium]|nr:phosphoribosylglycinamide formyltransferase [Balneolia bacterium]
MKKNIVVAASGSGSNFKALIDATQTGILNAKISGLIASREDIGAVQFAIQAAIPVYVLKNEPSSLGDQILEAMENFGGELLVLAGFLRKIPEEVIQKYSDRILNIHPSLLPKYGGKGFYGIRVHQAVINAGETHSGCTVHLVNEDYDQGRILAQKTVEVRHDDEPIDLAARILREEHQLYARTIQQYLESLNA